MATTTHALPFAWQVLVRGSWSDIDATTAIAMEAILTLTTTTVQSLSTVKVSGVPPSGQFDVEKMEYAGMSVRRCRKLEDTPEAHTVAVEYWDDLCWTPFDGYASCLIMDAVKAKRKKISVYAGGSAYDVCIDAPNLLQTNRSSGRSRPIRILGDFDLNDASDDDGGIELDDDDTMPIEFKCPITTMPRKHPVVAADGNSYDRDSIRRWFKSKQTSPVTGEILKHTEVVTNRALKKMMADYASAAGGGASSSSAPPPKKKMRAAKRV